MLPPLPRPRDTAPLGVAAATAVSAVKGAAATAAQRAGAARQAPEPPLAAWVRLVVTALPEVGPQRALAVALAACLERSAPTDVSRLRAPLLRLLDAFCAGCALTACVRRRAR
jgi:hypothetical protein